MADTVRVTGVGAYVKTVVGMDAVEVSSVNAYVKVRQSNDDVRATTVAAYVKVAKPWPVTFAYRVKDGYGNLLTSTDDVIPQPRSMGVRVTRRTHSVSGGVQDEFLYCEMLWSGVESITQFESILTQFGVLSADTNEVTVMVRSETLRWRTYNGVAVRPQQAVDVRHERYFVRDLVILVRELELT